MENDRPHEFKLFAGYQIPVIEVNLGGYYRAISGGTYTPNILVTGSTPYHIAYYVNRTIAGGHLFWRHSWRSDPMRERLSLDLIQRQSVPFVLSINDPALTDFARYPAIHRHLASHYVALDGTGGHVLIDARRQPTGTYEQLGFPCFR